MSNDIHQRLDADFAAPWKPQTGDKIVGVVTEITSRDGGFGEYPIINLKTGGGEVAVHAFHEVLRGELARIAPKPGDEIGIRYLGRHAEKNYHQYRVVRAGTGAFDWSKFSDEDAVEEVDADDLGF